MTQNYNDKLRLGLPFHIPRTPKPKAKPGDFVCPSCGDFFYRLHPASGWCHLCTTRFYLNDCR